MPTEWQSCEWLALSVFSKSLDPICHAGHMHRYVCMYVCMYACMYVCMYLCVYIYIYLCVCVCRHLSPCLCSFMMFYAYATIVNQDDLGVILAFGFNGYTVAW